MSNAKSRIDNPWQFARSKVVDILEKVTQLDRESIADNLETPPDSSLGDFATTLAFGLAKEKKKNPAKIAEDIAKEISELSKTEALLTAVKQKGPYINFYLSRGELADLTVKSVLTMETAYGNSDEYKGLRALIESPAVNPSKPWHIGHARNAVIGDTLANMLEAVGYAVLRMDYINDLGLQIAQLVWKLKDAEGPESNEKYDHYLGRLYVGVNETFESNERVEEQVREVSRRLEDLKSKEAKRSDKMVSDCVEAQSQTAYRLNIYHDYHIWESMIAYSGLLEQAKEMMLKCDNIFIPDEGDKKDCVIADLTAIDEFKDMKEPNKVLFRSDGTRTYTGADVAFQMWKFGIIEDPFTYSLFEEQPNDKPVYRTKFGGKKHDLGKVNLVFNVIGSGQAHPQRLVYSIMDLLGYHEQAKNSHHVAYEFVGLEEADFSGRKGTWRGYSCDDVLDKARELAKKEVSKRNPDESDAFKNHVAEQIGTGAVRYRLLNASPDRRITFRWEDALDFNGDAAPYLQYSCARASRILERAVEDESADLSLLNTNEEFALVKAIARFPEEVLGVIQGMTKQVWGTSFSTNRMTAYCYNLATLFSRFYDSCPVLKSEPDFRAARLQLVQAFRITMSNCLRLLGIPVVERM
ncbi:MAG: arginine--tRNA ligase [Candidatus Thorarchaeota archaeon]|nr:arginine--tRNA ligase [Candidatus Thorarchaeota archaeon]